MIESIINDEDLFPIWVSIGFDVYGYSQPLYWTDGITIFPDGHLETDDDLEDMLEEYASQKEEEEEEEDYDFIDDDDDLDFAEFSEANVGKEFSFLNFSEKNMMTKVVNDINFALVSNLDTISPEHIHEVTLFNAAVSAGHFSALRMKDRDTNFSEGYFVGCAPEQDILDVLIQDFGEAKNLTFRALGYKETEGSLRQSLRVAKQYIDNFSETSLPNEIVRAVHIATGLKKEDLAKTVIRLSLGHVNYQNLTKASMLSHLAFSI